MGESTHGGEFVESLIVFQHECCDGPLRRCELRGPVGQKLEKLSLVRFRFVGSARTHGLYYINVNFLGPCTNFFQISSPISCLVIDEGKNPGAETASSRKTGHRADHLEAGFLADVLGRGWIAAGSLSAAAEGGPMPADEAFERIGVAGLGVSYQRCVIYSRIVAGALRCGG